MISNAFLLNQKHDSFIKTGHGKLSRSTWHVEWLIVGLAILLLGILRVNYSLTQIDQWRELDNNGIIATFPVSQVNESRSFFGTEYNIAFGGEIGERNFSSNRSTDSYTPTFEDSVEVVDVLYLPDDTLTMEIARGFSFPLRDVALTLSIFTVGLTIVLYSLRQLYYVVQLDRNGEVIGGHITGVSKRLAGTQLNMTISYVFPSPDDGKMIAGNSVHIREKPQNRKLPDIGMPVAVLYLNNDHHQAL